MEPNPSDASENRETLIATFVADFHERLLRSESPQSDDYREQLGTRFDDFQRVVQAERVTDEGFAGKIEVNIVPPSTIIMIIALIVSVVRNASRKMRQVKRP